MKIGIACISMILLLSCTNSADSPEISADSAANALVDSNASIGDTNTYYNPESDSTNLPDEPGPTITPSDTISR